jgi:hypothetical protein
MIHMHSARYRREGGKYRERKSKVKERREGGREGQRGGGRESKEEREHREEGEGAKRTRERVQIAQGHHERERLGTPVHARARVFVHEGRSHECREPQTHTRAPFPLPSNLTTNPPETQIFSVA